MAKFSVVVPVTYWDVYDKNIAVSPDFKSEDIMTVSCNTSAGEAFNMGADYTEHDWILFCHQDVFFPKGFKAILEHDLENFPTTAVMGFIGINRDKEFSGMIMDRGNLLNFLPCNSAIGLDEVAVVINRRGPYRPDPKLGWHLWGADLCMRAPVRIVRNLIYHNSDNNYVLPEAYFESAEVLKKKYPGHEFNTTCGTFWS